MKSCSKLNKISIIQKSNCKIIIVRVSWCMEDPNNLLPFALWKTRKIDFLKPVSFSHSQPTNVHPILSESSRFIETEQIDSTADVDSPGINAEYAVLLEPRLSEDNATCHGGRQRWRHHDRYQVEGADDTVLDWTCTGYLHRWKQTRPYICQLIVQ